MTAEPLPWKDDGASPGWETITRLHRWNGYTRAADRLATPHAQHMIDTLEDHPPSAWPPGLRAWLEGAIHAGVAAALAVHEPPPLDLELRKVASTWAHVAALGVGMPSRIIDLDRREPPAPPPPAQDQ